MFNCNQCEKSFKSISGLNGHKRIHGPSNGNYSVDRKHKSRTNGLHSIHHFQCLNCEKPSTYLPAQSSGKYCSNKCQHEYNWRMIHIPAIEKGQCTNKKLLKKYLKEIISDVCVLCGQLPEHNGMPLTLQMDHIDGDSDNNLLTNLRLLCPNCHSQTPTFCSKKNNKNSPKQTKRNSYLRNYKKGSIPNQ